MTPDPAPAVRVFTREELYEKVWSEPVSTVAAELGKSGPVLYGFCRRHDVPTPPQGWWTRDKHGIAQVRAPLSPRENAAPIVIAVGPGRASAEARAAAKAAKAAVRPDPYPGYPHPEVTRLIARFRRGGRDWAGFVTKPRWGAPWLKVGRPSLSRLEAILGTLASQLKPLGGAFATDQEGVVIRIKHGFVMLKFTEGTTMVPYRPAAADKLKLSRWKENPRRSRADKPHIAIRAHAPDGRLRLELQPVNARGFRRDAGGSARCVFEDSDACKLDKMLGEVASAIVALTADAPAPEVRIRAS